MTRRLVVRINEDLCDGCGLCVPACAEGALRVEGGKARLVGDSFCDGLGACLGECPRGAITVEEREAESFDPVAVEKHLAAARACPVCPGLGERERGQWPVQLRLVAPRAPFLAGKEILVVADCVPVVCSDFQRGLRRDRPVLVGCPKLDDPRDMVGRLALVIREALPQGFVIAHMEVPCCHGLARLVAEAVRESARPVPVRVVTVGTGGEIGPEKACPGSSPGPAIPRPQGGEHHDRQG
ncbi:MAG: 4Fe-4S binding protein [bacterium]|nr:4Fe-4S binding protein [bacterium]